jgi:hypothetical protein
MNELFSIKRSVQRRSDNLHSLDDRLIRRVLALGLITGLAGCSHPADTSAGTAPGAAATGVPGANAAKSVASAARTLVPTKSTYDVALKPETKVIDADTIARTYRGAEVLRQRK